jgi:hypothetical protein
MLRDFLKDKSKYFFPSLADVLFVTLFLYLSFSVGKGLLNDADTGYHIRAGEYMLNTFSIPRNDLFSFLTPSLPWTAHEWLSEVIMALVHKPLGLTGVVVFFSFLVSLVYCLLFRMIRKNEGNIIIAVLLVLLVMASSTLHWLARPHIFSLLLIVIWYYLIDAFEYRQKNYLSLLPPIMLLWVNLHGGFITGFILIVIYLFGNFVELCFSKKRKTGYFTKGRPPSWLDNFVLPPCLAC